MVGSNCSVFGFIGWMIEVDNAARTMLMIGSKCSF